MLRWERYLWSTNKNLPSIAWREMNWIDSELGNEFRGGVKFGWNTFGMIRPTATRHDRLHESPLLSVSCSSSPILAGAHDFRYPVHWMTQYFLSELICFLRRWHPVNMSAPLPSLSCCDALHFMRQKKDRRAPGHKRDRSCGTSVLTGNIAGKWMTRKLKIIFSGTNPLV